MFEKMINKAIEFLADNKDESAQKIIDQCILSAQKNIKIKKDEPDSFFAWGMCLFLMEEYEQAILKFEKILTWEPDNEKALWQIVIILFHYLGKTQTAGIILREKLIKIDPDNSEYKSTLAEIDEYLSYKTNKKKK